MLQNIYFQTVKIDVNPLNKLTKVYDNLFRNIDGETLGEGTYAVVFKAESASNKNKE